MSKDKRPAQLARIEREILRAEGIPYNEMWLRIERAAAIVFMEHIEGPILQSKQPDPCWYSTFKSLLHMLERHKLPSGKALVNQQSANTPAYATCELILSGESSPARFEA